MDQYQLAFERRFSMVEPSSWTSQEGSTDWVGQTFSYWRSQSVTRSEYFTSEEITLSVEERFSGFNLTVDMKVFPVPSSISDEAAEFLVNRRELTAVSIEVLQSVTGSLRREGLIAESIITLEHDYETPDIDVLVFSFRIHGLSYERVLELWDDILAKVYAHVPAALASKIAIVMDEAP